MGKTKGSSGANTGAPGGGAFITQTKGDKIIEVKKEIAELELLLSSSSQTSQSTMLLKKRKEMKEVDETLEATKADYKRRMDECEERRLQFENKQAKLREQVLKFEKFIQENDLKRNRAELKAKHERKLFEDKCKEILALNNKIRDLESDQHRLHNDLIQKGCFRIYLERIVEDGDFGYEEIGDTLNRHRTLVEANTDLMKHAHERESQVDDLTKGFLALKTESQNHLLVSNSYIQELQSRLESLRSTYKAETDEKYNQEDKQKKLSRELSQITLGIKNIFNRCVTTMVNGKPASFGSAGRGGEGAQTTSASSVALEYMLEIIQGRMVDLMEILKEFREESSLGLGGPGFGDLSMASTSQYTIATATAGGGGGPVTSGSRTSNH